MKESPKKLVQLKEVVDSTMKEIEATDKENKIVLYSRAIDALSQILELSGDVNCKILRG